MKNGVKTAVLLAALAGIIMLFGSLLGRGGLTIAFIISLVMIGSSYFFSDKLAIRSARAVEVTREQIPQYYELMEELTALTDMPMPKLYVSPEQQPNAFATGRGPNHAAVCVTEGLLKTLSWGEIRGVLAHELAHVRNRDILTGSVAAMIATTISYAANMAMWGGLTGRRRDENGNPIILLAFAILAPMAAGLIQMAISRSREFEADRSAAAHAQRRRTAGVGTREVARLCPAHPVVGPAPSGQPLHREPAGQPQGQLLQAVRHPPSGRGSDRRPPFRGLAELGRTVG